MALKKLSLLVCASLALAAFTIARQAQAIERVRVVNGEFRTSAGAFTPRGVNLLSAGCPDGYRNCEYSVPAQFHDDKQLAEAIAQLPQFAHDGYNVVRVFIYPGRFSDSKGINEDVQGFKRVYDTEYLRRVADFVRAATSRGLYTLLVMYEFPYNQYYFGFVTADPLSCYNSQWVGATPSTPCFQGDNAYFMAPGYHNAKAQYLQDALSGLRNRLGVEGMKGIFAIDIANEAFMKWDQFPFNRVSGTFQTVAGPFNMGVVSSPTVVNTRHQARDANFVEWANRSVSAVKSVDPDALVTAGVFTYGAVGFPAFGQSTALCPLSPVGISQPGDQPCPFVGDPNENRQPARPNIFSTYSALDFIDIHVYPTNAMANWSLSADLQSSQVQEVTQKPKIIGEFGAVRGYFGNNVISAAIGMRNLQIESCSHGFKGWLYWTWDAYLDNVPYVGGWDQRQFFHLAENGGAINGVLAPLARPNPCQ